MYFISREFSFSYGHRLLDYQGKCARLHGHNGRVRITLGAERLNKDGMVLDFSDIKVKIEGWLNREMDHRMILKKGDPLAPLLIQAGEPVVLLEENPTAEFFARFIFESIRTMGLPVVSVEFWETKNCQAVYSEKI